MKISELIAELYKILAVRGDLVVYATDSDCCGCSCGPLKPIEAKVTDEFILIDGDKYAHD